MDADVEIVGGMGFKMGRRSGQLRLGQIRSDESYA